MIRQLIKSIATATCIIFIFSAIPYLEAAQFFFQSRKGGDSHPSGEIGIRIPFGEGTRPEKESIIEKYKKEETKGLGGLFGLVVLGACIVVAAVVIANKADDASDDVGDKIEEIGDILEDKIDEFGDKY